VGLAQSTAFEHQQRRFDFALAFLQRLLIHLKPFFISRSTFIGKKQILTFIARTNESLFPAFVLQASDYFGHLPPPTQFSHKLNSKVSPVACRVV
jgi:hypothetical protein